MKSFLNILKEKIIVFDGAMGTNLQAQNLNPDDFGGEKYYGCNEYLVVTNPKAVEKVHSDFLSAGCDVIETNTFGASSIVLSEYGLSDMAYKLNFEAAKIAKNIASQFSNSIHPRFVAGSMGPTTKLPSLSQITFKEMESAYYIQAKGLVEGGVDILIVETSQDILQAKAALCGIFSYFNDANCKIPVIVSVTIEKTGTMLLGTEVSAALTTIEPFEIDAFGLNCATGPLEMSEHIRYLCQSSPKPVLVMPNAGLPEIIGEKVIYKLSPDEFASSLSHFVKDLGVNIVGGCCGTTKEHIKKLVDAVNNLTPIQRQTKLIPSVSSLYQSVPLHIEPAPVLVGERINANGSKMFRELLLKDDWEGIVAIGKEQVKEGVHLLDICTAYAGRDEIRDMREIVIRFNTQIPAPLMIDSTEPQVIEEALQHISGKAIVNSINLEDGGERMSNVLRLCKKYGAAVIALTIDEHGIAKTAYNKFNITKRIYQLAVEKYGFRETDLIFDPLTFTIGSGDEESRKAGIETLEAIKLIKKEFPNVFTSLGISNISYGLVPQARHVLNSVFLQYAIENGLDMAIVNASKIFPLYKISEKERELSRKVIFDERKPGYDPLQEMIAYYSDKKLMPPKTVIQPVNIEDRLKDRIIEGNKTGIKEDLDKALTKYTPIEIINTILLDGMKTVGDYFGSGKMQLPFVLQSAETMKTAINYLEKFIGKANSTKKGTLVLATVKGDVHDIGKNLVDIILSNNGYKIINLGIQCPVEKIIQAVLESSADAIGMSGLLVKSTFIMKENLEVLNERGISIPVILGGAALTPCYVENELKKIYHGNVFYARDAFDGLRYMEQITRTPKVTSQMVNTSSSKSNSTTNAVTHSIFEINKTKHKQIKEVDIPAPPFWGTKIIDEIPLEEIFPYINTSTLYKKLWGIHRKQMSEKQYSHLLETQIYPEYRSLQKIIIKEKLLQPKVVYGYFPCQSENNDLIIYKILDPSMEDRKITNFTEWVRFTFPRQTKGKLLCISDFFASKATDKIDTVGFFVATMGNIASEYSQHLFKSNKYKDYLYFHGLSVIATEALAEYWHKKIRQELGIHGQDPTDIEKLLRKKYRGRRYSFGYSVCPNLEDQAKLFTLLQPERIGVTLTENYQLVPEQSISAMVVHHPDAIYFSV